MNTLEVLPIDTAEICQPRLDVDEKVRSNLFQWNGQFSPQFIEALLEKYANKGLHVLDPIMGSGTVLYECARLGLKTTATDINPAAYSIAKTYQLCHTAVRKRKHLLTMIENKLANQFPFTENPPGRSFFCRKAQWKQAGAQPLNTVTHKHR